MSYMYMYGNMMLICIIPLSLSIRHRAGVFVNHIIPRTPADECGCIHVGDQILEANGYDLRYATLERAAMILGVRYGHKLMKNLCC